MEDKKTKPRWPDKVLERLSKSECRFLNGLLYPLVTCFKHGFEFFIWIMFVVVAGQLGTIINIINRIFFLGWDWPEALYPDSVSGSFYTYALVLIASLIAPLFLRIRDDKKPWFRSMTIVFMTLVVFALILCAVFFSFSSQVVRSVRYEDFKDLQLVVDGKQLFFYVIALLFSWYAFGLSLMVRHKEGLENDDDHYLKDEQEEVGEMEEKSEGLITDGNNTAL